MSAKARLLYILAPSYSGSTLLTYLLAHHPSIATIGELKATQMGAVEEYRCSCGMLLNSCAFWREVSARCADGGIPFSLEHFDTVLRGRSPLEDRLVRANVRGPLLETLRTLGFAVLPGARSNLARQVQRNFQLGNIITAVQEGEIFLDGSKDAARLLHFLRSNLWDIKVIYLQRDGRGVINSIAKHLSVPFDDAAARWAKDASSLQRARAMLPSDIVLDVKYEELCRNPSDNLAAIFAWLGIEPIPIATTNFKAGDFHILGNSMRLSQIADVRLDEGWRSRVTAAENDRYLRKFGAIHRRLGYT